MYKALKFLARTSQPFIIVIDYIFSKTAKWFLQVELFTI